MATDPSKELRRAVDSGKVLFGKRQVEKSAAKGSCKLVITSQNAEKYAKERIQQLCSTTQTPFYEFKASSQDIGSYCGKPFSISFACIENPGKSKILELAKN
jgi:large subunit ribosomal protein L30e